MNTELKAIEAALQEPFPCDMVLFKPGQPHHNTQSKRWECVATPFVHKQVYEDRLNDVAFGQWGTPSSSLMVVGNKLIATVTVMLYGVSHTDFGEAFLANTLPNGERHEAEKSATEAYTEAFGHACAQFGLGRYLCSLPLLWLPYNPITRTIHLSEGERIAWVEKVYMEAGLSPRPKRAISVSPQGRFPEVMGIISSPPAPQPQVSVSRPPVPKAPTANLVDAVLLASIQRESTEKQKREALRYYKVADLAHLTPMQATELSQFIEERKHQKKTAPAGAPR